MANRAYLYSSETPHQWEWEDDGGFYYDSRHSFPLIWWFLFRSDNIKQVDFSYGDSTWEEIRLVAHRLEALTLFQKRLTSLIRVCGGRVSEEKIRDFYETLLSWKGNYLIVDPSQIFENELAEDLPQILRFICSLDDVPSLEDAPYFADTSDVDKLEVKLLGYTYR